MLAVKNTSTRLSSSTTNRSRMAHKFDTGFHHYNLQQTSREALASRAPSGLLGTALLKIRSLAPDGDSNSGNSNTPDEELLLAYGGQGSGVTGSTQPPQEVMGHSSRGAKASKGQGTGDRDLLNAHWYPTMPQGDEAHNAAHCEPVPGDWPDPAPVMKPADALSPDENLDAIHAAGAAHAPGSGPVGGTSAGAARDDSSYAAHGLQGGGESGQQQQQGSGDFHAASRPGDDPQGIKDVVRQETLGEGPQDRAA